VLEGRVQRRSRSNNQSAAPSFLIIAGLPFQAPAAEFTNIAPHFLQETTSRRRSFYLSSCMNSGTFLFVLHTPFA
jgi:hypothetical protein